MTCKKKRGAAEREGCSYLDTGVQCVFTEIKVMPGFVRGIVDGIAGEITAPKEKIKIPCLWNEQIDTQ
jgi:hypothetical protein